MLLPVAFETSPPCSEPRRNAGTFVIRPSTSDLRSSSSLTVIVE